jgi:hypothetical protein
MAVVLSDLRGASVIQLAMRTVGILSGFRGWAGCGAGPGHWCSVIEYERNFHVDFVAADSSPVDK